MKKIIIVAAVAGCLTAVLQSCSKKLDLAPVSSISDENFWQTGEQVDAFVTGVHTRFRSHTSSFQYLGEMRADIFGHDPGTSSAFTGESSQGLERLWLNNLDMDSPGVSDFGGFYSNINQINLLISKLKSTDVVSAANKDYYLGVAYGMRAFYYFQLLRSWGKVIIQTEPTTSVDISNLAKAAATEQEVMTLIKQDIDNSNNSFGTNYAFMVQKGFWSKSATQMLKAEVYLWTSYRGGGATDATTAKNALTEIRTNVPSLALLPSYANIFTSANKGNAEIIFATRYKLDEAQLPFAGTFFPQNGLIANFYDSVENRKFNVATDNWGGLLRAPTKIATFRRFNDLDSRKWATVQPAYEKPATGPYRLAGAFVKKYQGEQNAGTRQFTNDFPIYRFADLLLLLAEAKTILGENPAAEINQVRQRAYGANYNAAVYGFPNQPGDGNLKEAILQERFYEFIFEGKRWYDLRMGDEYVYKYTNIPSSESYKLLWPLDRNTLTNNRSLKQNPGYPQF